MVSAQTTADPPPTLSWLSAPVPRHREPLRKWHEAGVGLSTGMTTSRGRVDEAAEPLQKAADNYGHPEVQNTAGLDRLARGLLDD